MKINDIILENLGGLADLNAGPLINVLKQEKGRGFKRSSGSYATPDGNKFPYGSKVGNKSTVIDIGVLKTGLAGIRKAYRVNAPDGNSAGFALYIGGKCVAVIYADDWDLGGASRSALIAWDLRDYIKPEETKPAYQDSYSRTKRTPNTSFATTQSYDEKIQNLTGEAISVDSLKNRIEIIEKAAADAGKPLTAKLILSDPEKLQKRRERFTRQEIVDGTVPLMQRLKAFKLAKNPTASSIEDFVKTALAKSSGLLRFGNITYDLKPSQPAAMDPMSVLKGKPFEYSYSARDNGVYSSLYIRYAYDTVDRELKAVSARWEERNPSRSQSAVLDAKSYMRIEYGIKDVNDKQSVIPKILELIKSNQLSKAGSMMHAVEKENPDWPELAIVKKTLDAEAAKK